jgi:hypothetical protein
MSLLLLFHQSPAAGPGPATPVGYARRSRQGRRHATNRIRGLPDQVWHLILLALSTVIWRG